MQIFKNADFISCEKPNRIFRYLVEERGKIVFTGDVLPEYYKHLNSTDLKTAALFPPSAILTHILLPFPISTPVLTAEKH